MMKYNFKKILPLIAILILPACSVLSSNDVAEVSSMSEVSAATVTAVGTIGPMQVKIYDMGTHVLIDDKGNMLYVLASTAVDLGRHIGQKVEVKGSTMSLGNSGDQLLSVKELRSLTESTTGNEAIEAAKSLAKDYDPPYIFTESDPAEIVSTSIQSGITIVRIKQSMETYLVKMVRAPDPVTGDFSIFAIEPEEDSQKDVDEEEESSIPEEDDEEEASSMPDEDDEDEVSSIIEEEDDEEDDDNTSPTAVDQVSHSDSATVSELVSSLGSYLSQTEFSGNFSVTMVEVSENNKAYITFEDGDDKGMVLVSWTSTPATAKVEATFVPGEVSDWVKESGDNIARNESLTIYTLQSGSWTAKATTKEGYSLYANSGLNYRVQYPSQWYYALNNGVDGTVSRIGFSNKPVDEENTLLTLDIISGSIESVVANYSGVTPTTVGGSSAYRGTVDGKTVMIVTRNDNSVFVISAVPEAAGQVSAMAETLEAIK